MDYKKTNAPLTTTVHDIIEMAEPTGNIYETVCIISKRANQIAAAMKEDLEKKGAVITLTIKGDGTFSMNGGGSAQNGTWTEKSSNTATLSVNNSPLDFQLKDNNTLVTTDAGTTMTFTRQ